MSTRQKWLIIPIDTKVREFNAKFYLACVAAEAGFHVILGYSGIVTTNLGMFPKGIFFDKTILEGKAKRFKKYKDLGFNIVACDEEGLVYYTRESYKKRISAASMAYVDRFYTWGEDQAEVFNEKIPEYLDKVKITGNPRSDLLRPELRLIFKDKLNEIKSKWGDIILVNTNFAAFNHFLGQDLQFKAWTKNGKLKTEMDIENHKLRIQYQEQLFTEFNKFLPIISEKYPNHKIIVRPHPTENYETWKEKTINYKNVEIIHDGNVVPWLMASKVLIHNSCTTGVEAFCLNIPIISYRPVSMKLFDAYLSNSLSHEVYNIDELVDQLDTIINNNEIPEQSNEKVQFAKRYITGLEGKFSSENIVEDLNSIDLISNDQKMSILMKLTLLGKSIIILLKRFIKSNYFNFKNSDVGAKHKYTKQIQQRLFISELKEYHQSLISQTGKFRDIKYKKILPDCFVLYSTKK